MDRWDKYRITDTESKTRVYGWMGIARKMEGKRARSGEDVGCRTQGARCTRTGKARRDRERRRCLHSTHDLCRTNATPARRNSRPITPAVTSLNARCITRLPTPRTRTRPTRRRNLAPRVRITPPLIPSLGPKLGPQRRIRATARRQSRARASPSANTSRTNGAAHDRNPKTATRALTRRARRAAHRRRARARGEGVQEGEAVDGVGGADAGEEERVFGFVVFRLLRLGGKEERQRERQRERAKALRTRTGRASAEPGAGCGTSSAERQVRQRAAVCLDRRPGGGHAAAHGRCRGVRGCDGAKAIRGVEEDVCGREGVVRDEDVGLRRPDVLPVPQPRALTTTDIDLRPPLLHLIRNEGLQLHRPNPSPTACTRHRHPSPRAATSLPAASRGNPPPTTRPGVGYAAHTSQDPEINHLLVQEGMRAV
ncbi:hypothetical protein B0H14DRAFT_2578183 [Mycena olivaceomarginata]|nr:hypothetical protein B0H14DRAFT_2578183 [Mycena olivaceomarginata]